MERTCPVANTKWFFRLKAFSRPVLFDIAGITHLITAKPMQNPRLKLIAQDTITGPNFCGGWWKQQPVYLYENLHVLPRAFFVAENQKFSAVPVKLKFVAPDRLQIQTQGENSGIVVVSESFHPGWNATERNRPIALQPFLDTFISFYVPAGEHNISLKFCPRSFYLGLQFTLTGILLIILILLIQKKDGFFRKKG
jgi:hypothetical protein